MDLNAAEFKSIVEGLRKAAAAFREADVRYCLSGSVASWARGGPETVNDVDLIVDPERAAERLDLARETTRVALDQTRALSAELKRLQEEELEEGVVYSPDWKGARLFVASSTSGLAATLKPTPESDIKMEIWMPATGWNGNGPRWRGSRP